MPNRPVPKIALSIVLASSLAACGAIPAATSNSNDSRFATRSINGPNDVETDQRNTIWSIFNRKTADSSVSVNKYLWSASLEVLNFLPIQSIDPYTGVIVTGYGTPPGSGQSYRATVLIDDPALDARSLNLSLQTRGGRTVNTATARAVEDAILSRAREMRIGDDRF